MKVGKITQTVFSNRVNREIRAKEVRLTDTNGKQIGIVNLNEALEKAEKSNSDLIEINPNAIPPVCRIMNYGKFLYEKSKFIKEQKKKQKIMHIKEIKFRPGTDNNDFQRKLHDLARFLKNGNKVKITLRFRGREITHQQIGIKILNRISNDLNGLATIEYFPVKIEGRQMIMTLTPKKK